MPARLRTTGRVPAIRFTRRRTLARLPSLLLLGLLLPAACPVEALAAPRDLQATGSKDHLWLARVGPAPTGGGRVTTLYVRDHGVEKWTRLGEIPVRVSAMASRGSQLAILLPGGEWRLTTADSGLGSGRPLPGGARMVAIASDGMSLWAAGVAPKVEATTTSTAATTSATTGPVPATAIGPATATASTAPSTAPSAAASDTQLVLYRLGPQVWEPLGRLPEPITFSEGTSLALGVADGKPLVAQKAGDRAIRAFRHVDVDKWEPLPTVENPSDVAEYRLLGGTARPVLWVRGTTGPARLWIDGKGTELAVPGQAEHAIAYGLKAIRALWVDDERIFDQRFSEDTGLPEGDPQPLPVPAASILPAVQFWTQVTLTGVLVVALLAALRRRREMQDAAALDPAKLRLAPFSTRLLAGAIDAVPLVAASYFANARFGGDATELGWIVTILIGAGAYVLLTAVVELAAGRSLGKLLTGLYVIGLDGKPAKIGPRLMRNVLRVIDLPVMPLALILFSPLRQRAGDLAAGTVVVRGKPEAKPDRDAREQDDDEKRAGVKNDVEKQ